MAPAPGRRHRSTGRRDKPNVIPAHELKWLQADRQAHRHMETVLLNHSPVALGDPNLHLRNRLQLMSVLKLYPQARWYFCGHHRRYERARWAHIDIIKVSCGSGDDLRYARGALVVKGGETRWYRWGGAYWYIPKIVAAARGKYNSYHRTLLPTSWPQKLIEIPIPDLPAKSDEDAPAAPANLRPRKLGPGRVPSGSIALQWEAVSDADYYDVYRQGKRIGGALYPRFIDYDLQPGGKYTYELFARDIAGNRSARPARGTFTCLAHSP